MGIAKGAARGKLAQPAHIASGALSLAGSAGYARPKRQRGGTSSGSPGNGQREPLSAWLHAKDLSWPA
jgi:hypothetical protein